MSDLAPHLQQIQSHYPLRPEAGGTSACLVHQVDVCVSPQIQTVPNISQTVSRSVSCQGIGLHRGEAAQLTIHPCEKPIGIQFYLKGEYIPASWRLVQEIPLCTLLVSEQGTKIATIEHLMAALHAHGIDHATIELSNHEIPILDGSSKEFMDLIEQAGYTPVHQPKSMLRILKPVFVQLPDGRQAGFVPSERRIFEFHLDFSSRGLPVQSGWFDFDAQSFRHDIATARTFGFFEDVEAIWAYGMAKGGSLDNAVVFQNGQAMNPDGLRFDDEPVRHKILDAVGDLFLAGSGILGHYIGHNAGHALNHQLLAALFQQTQAWRLENF